jgi:ABC-type phosphate transport system substrate-binding protein
MKKFSKNFCGFWLGLFLAGSLSLTDFAHAEIAIVVGLKSTIESISLDELRRVYLGKADTLASGKSVVVYDQTEGSQLWKNFAENVLGKSAKQIKSYWSIQIFTGKGTPPRAVGNSEEVMTIVSRDPRGIGYIDAGEASDRVKILLRVK